MTENHKSTNAAIFLDLWRASFAEGDRYALLQALAFCLDENYRVPKWVKDGVVAAVKQVQAGKVKSWDDVFGSVKPVGRRGKRWTVAHAVLMEVVGDKAKGIAVDFDLIGQRLHISGGKAREYYYEFFGPRIRDGKTSKKSR